MTVDPLAALRAVVVADATVSALTTHVFAGEIPEADNNLMPRASVVLSPSGGPGSSDYLDFGASRVDVWCYGANLHEAYVVYLAVYQALKQMRRQKVPLAGGNVLLHTADPLSKGSTGRDPEKQWPTCLSSWLVKASEIAAA